MSEKTKNWKDNISLGLLITAITFIGTFYIEWRTDEASEDMEKETNKNLMFDTTVDKVETNNLVKAVKPAAVQVKWAKDEMAQEKILEKLSNFEKANKKQDCLLIRLNDQYYQLNKKVE